MLSTKSQVDRYVEKILHDVSNACEKSSLGCKIAKLYFDVRVYNTALEYINDFISVKKDFAPAFQLLGEILEALGRASEAAEAYERAYSLVPSNTEVVIKIRDVVMRNNLPVEKFNKYVEMSSNPYCSWKNEERWIASCGISSDPFTTIGERITLLRKFVSDDCCDKAFDLCSMTINEFVCIERTSWYNAVLDFVSNVPTSFRSRSWYNQIDTLKGFALVEILRLTAHTACLFDFLSTLSQVDAFIVEALRLSQSHDANFVAEMQLRLFFYLSVYIQRAAKMKRINTNVESTVSEYLTRAADLGLTGIIAENPLSFPVWEHVYTNGLALKLQSTVLASKSNGVKRIQKEVLQELLYQDNLSSINKFKFEFLHGLSEPTPKKSVQNLDEIYRRFLNYRSTDLITILWYILCHPCSEHEVKPRSDLALPSSRLKIIADTVRYILSDAPFTSESNSEVCQMDAFVFLIALSISYLIRYSSSSDAERSSDKTEPLSWPNLPLCLLGVRLIPSGLQRRCWLDLCSCSTNAGRFLTQLRFTKSTHTMSPRLALRVAKAISCFPLDDSAINSVLAVAARIWEFGLKALVCNSGVTLFNSPALKLQDQCPHEADLFPNELNSDWWYGTYVENLLNVAAKDEVWLILGWSWLTSYWLEHPTLPKLGILIDHVKLLGNIGLPPGTDCLLSVASLTRKAIEQNKSSPLLRSLVSLTLDMLYLALSDAQKMPLPDETTVKTIRDISEAIGSLQRISGLPNSSESTQSTPDEPIQHTNMPSGYGAYSNAGRSSNFGLMGTPTTRASGLFSEDGTYRSPRIPSNSLINASTAAVVGTPAPSTPDPQIKLLTQMMEQWMPSFLEFSKVMSETSVELAKSRLQNEELSRMLKETRSQLDSVIAEHRKQQHVNPSPVKQPERSAPSLEDWQALQESLHEVTATLRDFRRWLPSAMPPPSHPPPLFNHPPPPLPPAPGPQPSDMLMMDSYKAQMALNHLFQQQRQLQQSSNSVPSCILPQPPLTTGIGPQFPAVDLRVPPSCLFHTTMTPPQSTVSFSAPSSNPVKVIPITPVKPPVAPTFTAATTTSALPMASPKSTTAPPAVQEPSTPLSGGPHSPAVSKASPFFFQPAHTTSTSSTATGGESRIEGSPSLFSFSNLAKSVTSGLPTPAVSLFGNPIFGSKSAVSSSLSCSHSNVASDKSIVEAPKAAAGDDEPETFEPNVDFKPCLEKLPELVEQTTGEENETVLFCHRARLFRWDKPKSEATGEWKARGIGELKVLANEETDKYRIVMRRDQVMKLCANHYILPGINIKRHPQKAVACLWNARDFAVMDPDNFDLNGMDELFMVTFKTVELADEFEKIVESCLKKSTLGTYEKKDSEENPGAKPKSETQIGKKSESEIGVEGNPAPGLDAFTSKPGSWTCSGCLLVLDPSKAKCPACNTLKPGTTPSPDEVKQESKFTFGTTSATVNSKSSSFNFSSTAATTSTPNSMPSFVCGTSGLADPPKFNFGNPTPTASAEKSTFIFSKFGSSMSDNQPLKEPSNTSGAFSGLNLTFDLEKSGTAFTFNMTPSTSKNKEPETDEKNKSCGVEHDDVEDGEVTPSESSQVTFKPLIDHLPDQVEVVTGEEGEDILFEARAKLFRFDSNNGDATWKERGLGKLKILKNQTTDRVRLVMRREQIHKVCCNHWITPGMTLKLMEGSKAAVTPWVWWAIDFSDEEAGPEGRREMLSVRFSNAADSQAFHDSFVKAAGVSTGEAANSEVDANEVEIVDNPLPSEKVERARALQLPDDFYAYELKKPGISARSGNVRSEGEKMTSFEEAAEDALLEDAVSRGIRRVPSSSSSFDVVKSSESLVIATPPISPPPPTNPEASKTSMSPKTPKNKPSLSDSSGGLSSVFGTSLMGSSGRFEGFGALSKNAGAQPSWLKPRSPDDQSPWAGAGSALFSSLKADTKGDSKDEKDENEPDPHFEPLIPLPSLVEAKTGEEGEVCLYLRRCKLYRMVANQWKERGIGDLKILVRPKNELPLEYLDPRSELPADAKLEGGISYARILMRRDQVFKICANHTISAELPHFKPLSVTNYGLCWGAKDFSEEEEGEVMTLGLKFKTEQDLTQFNAAIERAREMLKED